MRSAQEKTFTWKSAVSPKSASGLWTLELALQHKAAKDPSGSRLVVIDDFYASRAVAKKLSEVAGGEMKGLGAVRFDNINGANRPLARQAVSQVREKGKGNWRLAQELDSAMCGGIERESVCVCVVMYVCGDA